MAFSQYQHLKNVKSQIKLGRVFEISGNIKKELG